MTAPDDFTRGPESVAPRKNIANVGRVKMPGLGSGEPAGFGARIALSVNASAAALLLLMVCTLFPFVAFSARAVDTNAFLQAWFAAQTNLHTWSADFVQTRTLKALVQPLQANGKLWFSAPDRFRWEIVAPIRTIALRQPDSLLVIYPNLKRAERYPLRAPQTAPWRDALALLEAGFPQSRAEFEEQFRLLSVSEAGGAFDVAMEPRSRSARRFLTQIQVRVRTNDFVLVWTEVKFSDGSVLRNEFSQAVANANLEEALFNPKLEADFTVTEPLRK